jgi:hypothetical protein
MLSDERIIHIATEVEISCANLPHTDWRIEFAHAIEAEVTKSGVSVSMQTCRTIADSIVGSLEGRKQVLNLDFEEELVEEIMDDITYTIKSALDDTTPQPCPNCELYAAEMSAAREAGFETAQDLFTSYVGLKDKCAEPRAENKRLTLELAREKEMRNATQLELQRVEDEELAETQKDAERYRAIKELAVVKPTGRKLYKTDEFRPSAVLKSEADYTVKAPALMDEYVVNVFALLGEFDVKELDTAIDAAMRGKEDK